MDCPLSKVEVVAAVRGSELWHTGAYAMKDGILLQLKAAPQARSDDLYKTHMTATNSKKTKVFELVPQFKYNPATDGMEAWGNFPKAPGGQQKLAESVALKWEAHQQRDAFFLSFKDGNTAHCTLENIVPIDLAVALKFKVYQDPHGELG